MPTICDASAHISQRLAEPALAGTGASAHSRLGGHRGYNAKRALYQPRAHPTPFAFRILNPKRGVMPAPTICGTWRCQRSSLSQASMPAPIICDTCDASACRHRCQHPLFATLAMPALAGIDASTHYLRHLRCQRTQASLPAPIICDTCDASARRHQCQHPLFAALAMPALAGIDIICDTCDASARRHRCQHPLFAALAMPALQASLPAPIICSICDACAAGIVASTHYLQHLRCLLCSPCLWRSLDTPNDKFSRRGSLPSKAQGQICKHLLRSWIM